MTDSYGHLIDGRERLSASGRTFDSVDPATGQVVASFSRGSAADVDDAVAAAGAAAQEWASLAASERGRYLSRIAAAITERADDLADFEARDCGKVLSQARADIATAARYLEYFAGASAVLHGEQIPIGPEVLDIAVRAPHGVCAQINAWNFPLNMAARSLAPALAAGNTVVIKTPELAPTTTAILSRIATEVGLPPGVLNVVHGFGAEAGAALASHPNVDLVTFTGSVATGRIVASQAARNGVPCVMELGGKSPTVVFEDADIVDVAQRLARGFVEANGQSCDLPSLALVHHRVHDAFVDEMVRTVKTFSIGRAVDDPDVGPLISEPQLARVQSYLAAAREQGATLAVGGSRPQGAATADGWYIEPTIVTKVTGDMTIAREEVFGPVLAVMVFDDEEEAVRLANQSDYGLAAFIFTADTSRGLRMVREIRAGQVYLNCFSSGDSVMVPFGGFKSSGYGREKGFEALRTYTRTKNICISMASRQVA